MFKLIKEGELKFPEKPACSPEAKDFIIRVSDLEIYSNTMFLTKTFLKKCLNRDRQQRLGAKSDL